MGHFLVSELYTTCFFFLKHYTVKDFHKNSRFLECKYSTRLWNKSIDFTHIEPVITTKETVVYEK